MVVDYQESKPKELFRSAWRVAELIGGTCNRQMDGDVLKRDLRVIHNYTDSQEVKESIYQLSQHLFCGKTLDTEEIKPLKDCIYNMVTGGVGVSPMKGLSEKSIVII